MPWRYSLLLEAIKAGFGLLLLAIGWIFGQKIIASWDLRKKQRELDVNTAVQFQQLYGEFKEVGRLWRESKKPTALQIGVPKDLRWTMLARGANAESKYEALVMKLASERLLSKYQLAALGLFRQACQQLRQSIRVDGDVSWTDFTTEYLLFNDLAAEVTCLIGGLRPRKPVPSEVARKNLKAVAYVRGEDWNSAVKEYKESLKVSPDISPLNRVLHSTERNAWSDRPDLEDL